MSVQSNPVMTGADLVPSFYQATREAGHNLKSPSVNVGGHAPLFILIASSLLLASPCITSHDSHIRAYTDL